MLSSQSAPTLAIASRRDLYRAQAQPADQSEPHHTDSESVSDCHPRLLQDLQSQSGPSLAYYREQEHEHDDRHDSNGAPSPSHAHASDPEAHARGRVSAHLLHVSARGESTDNTDDSACAAGVPDPLGSECDESALKSEPGPRADLDGVSGAPDPTAAAACAVTCTPGPGAGELPAAADADQLGLYRIGCASGLIVAGVAVTRSSSPSTIPPPPALQLSASTCDAHAHADRDGEGDGDAHADRDADRDGDSDRHGGIAFEFSDESRTDRKPRREGEAAALAACSIDGESDSDGIHLSIAREGRDEPQHPESGAQTPTHADAHAHTRAHHRQLHRHRDSASLLGSARRCSSPPTPPTPAVLAPDAVSAAEQSDGSEGPSSPPPVVRSPVESQSRPRARPHSHSHSHTDSDSDTDAETHSHSDADADPSLSRPHLSAPADADADADAPHPPPLSRSPSPSANASANANAGRSSVSMLSARTIVAHDRSTPLATAPPTPAVPSSLSSTHPHPLSHLHSHPHTLSHSHSDSHSLAAPLRLACSGLGLGDSLPADPRRPPALLAMDADAASLSLHSQSADRGTEYCKRVRRLVHFYPSLCFLWSCSLMLLALVALARLTAS